MERNEIKLVTIEESNERFASLSEQAKKIQELSDKISSLINSFVNQRESKGLSQRDLADRLGWKQPALARMERLEVIPRLDTFLKAVMEVGGNVYIEYFENAIPTQCIKSSKYQTSIDGKYHYSPFKNMGMNYIQGGQE